MSITILDVPSAHETAAADYMELTAEALFKVQDADAELARALTAINALRPATAAAAIGQARALLRFALSLHDMESLTQQYAATKPHRCPTCHGTRTVYYSGDPADERDDCPNCTVE